jgi:small subunit ribosomal protein S17
MTNVTKNLAKKKGVVVSDKMDKTIVVAVSSLKTHPKYHKKYRSTVKYKVHDSKNTFKKGDSVEFLQCRPISKDKSHTVITK